jgi:hypothetical protein
MYVVMVEETARLRSFLDTRRFLDQNRFEAMNRLEALRRVSISDETAPVADQQDELATTQVDPRKA